MTRASPSAARGASRAGLLGRDEDLVALARLLSDLDIRLVTLIGPGGVGKTRLARAVAEDAGESFPDGATFVPLAPAHDAAQVTSAVAAALGIREEGDRGLTDAIHAELAGLEMLLVLDNFEHVLDAAPLVAELLERCPGVTVLVTSRSSLRLSGEHAYPLEPLAVPATERPVGIRELADVPSVALFLERARMVAPSFALTDDNAADVAAICARLDGLPLSLQLAGAGLKLLSPDQMLGRLERPLDVLIGGPRDLPTRQQTLRETLEWSYQLLQPSEQQTFRRLAVFAAGSSPHAAETIAGIAAPAGAVLADLIGLVDHSLLRRVEAHEDDARLMMLQTVKAFAAEELAASGEEPMIRAAHADFFLAMAEEAAPRFRFRVDDQAIDQIEREHDNLRAALRWCIDSGDSGRAVRLGAALARFWLVRGHLGDGRRWLDAVLALDAGQAPAGARAQALCGAGLLAHFQNQYDIAIERFEESLELARAVGDRQAVMQALSALAATVGRHRDPAAARGMYDEALAIAAELEDEEMTASLRLGLATIVWYQGDLTGASPMLHDSLAGAEAHDLAYESAGAHQILGYLALAEGELDGARAQLEAGMAALGKLHDRWGVARCKMGLGYAEDAARDFPAARAHFADCLAIIGELGHKLITCGCIGGLAIAAEAEGRPEVAATLLGAAAAIRERLGASHSQVVQEAQDRCLAAAREALGEPSFEHAFTVGSALTLDEARALAEREAREGSASEAAAGLTLAELRVLRLVAGGRTNADVAAVLVVSERTVHAHLRAIFRKLGVSNRGAATRYAVEHGIVE